MHPLFSEERVPRAMGAFQFEVTEADVLITETPREGWAVIT